ncbi:unnamed protein product [Linum tenue]|uniref:Transketolase-like pyrimidine-binding domain-containing protein n=1 Tax=Linum tenue TaxID=586396 RepID=A0AAV0Q0G3_9ROSI|nr:unnamed protein product [Linum tenue]
MVKTGQQFKPKSSTLPYTRYFAESLVKEAETDNKIVAIHAEMGGGTGPNYFQKKFPIDALTWGSLSNMLSPLQLGYLLKVVNDVDLQKLLGWFAMDRVGLFEVDWPYLCGAFYIAYMICLPNMVVIAPSEDAELMHMVETAATMVDRVSCFRFPAGNILAAVLLPNN